MEKPVGSYIRTSRNIAFTQTSDDQWTLAAECQKIDGTWAKSELTYNIANCDGQLEWAPTGC
jgi:CVNH domain